MNGVPVVPPRVRIADAAMEELFIGKMGRMAGIYDQLRQTRRQVDRRHESRMARDNRMFFRQVFLAPVVAHRLAMSIVRADANYLT